MPDLRMVARTGITFATLLLGVVTIVAISTHYFRPWPAIVVVVSLLMMALGLLLLWRRPDGLFFEPLVVLLPGLTLGRLLSTAWLVPPGMPSPRLDALSLGETGPGLPFFEPLTILLTLLVVAFVLLQARRSIIDGIGGTRLLPTDWLATFLRAYVGLMFVSHYTGHVLAGDIQFDAFTRYFAQVGMPLPAASVVLAGMVEIAVCMGLAFGVLTRLAAAVGAFYVLLSVGIGGHFSNGYSWVLPNDGWEFPALWAFAIALFAVFGAGPVSIDAVLMPRIFRRT